jgi:hypothetical protein
VFKTVEGGVNYRTVGWLRAAVIFLKVSLSISVYRLGSEREAS